MKSFLQKCVLFFQPLFPHLLGILFYQVIFLIFKKSLRGEKGEIWYRNSLYFEDLVFGLSDIDMTFLLPVDSGFSQVLRIEKRLAFFRHIFPVLGEINYYEIEVVKNFLPMANPYELKRDPTFLRVLDKNGLISLIQKEGNTGEQVFVLNWISSDAYRMKQYFNLRKKKISRFLMILNQPDLSDEIFDLDNLLINVVKNFFPLDYHTELISFLSKFSHYQFHSLEAQNKFYEENVLERRLYMCLYPQKWMGASLHFETFEEDLSLLQNMDTTLKKIFLGQVRWEIWGLFTQWMRSGDDVNFHLHSVNLIRAVSTLGASAAQELKSLKILVDLHESKLHEGNLHAS